MTESLPSTQQFPDQENPDPGEEFEPSDATDPQEPETMPEEEDDLADPGEADQADVVEQEAPVSDPEDGYDRGE